MNFNKIFEKFKPKETIKKVAVGAGVLATLGGSAAAEGVASKDNDVTPTEINIKETEKPVGASKSTYVVKAEDFESKKIDEDSPKFKLALVKKALENCGGVYIDENKPGYLFFNKGLEKQRDEYAIINVSAFNYLDLEKTGNYFYTIQLSVNKDDKAPEILERVNKEGVKAIASPVSGGEGVIVRKVSNETDSPTGVKGLVDLMVENGMTREEALVFLNQIMSPMVVDSSK